jgi:hypothetical protein
MSAQGGTIGRGRAVQLPLAPVVVAIVAAFAVAIGLTVFSGASQDRIVTTVSPSERLANSSAAVREQGGSLPVARPFDTSGIESASLWTPAQAEAYQAQLRFEMQLFQGSAAAIREQGGIAYHAPGRAHEVAVTAAPSTTTFATGLENPGAYGTDEAIDPGAEPYRPIMVNGHPCAQCR